MYTKRDHITIQSFNEHFFFFLKIYHEIGSGDDFKQMEPLRNATYKDKRGKVEREEKRKKYKPGEEKSRRGKKRIERKKGVDKHTKSKYIYRVRSYKYQQPPSALASMSMHTKLNICAITKQATFPH